MRTIDHVHQVDGEWPFSDPPNTGVFMSAPIIDAPENLIGVSHDFEGDWQFLDGGSTESDNCAIACLYCVFQNHPDVGELAMLPRGWQAWRDEDGEWVRFKKSRWARFVESMRAKLAR